MCCCDTSLGAWLAIKEGGAWNILAGAFKGEKSEIKRRSLEGMHSFCDLGLNNSKLTIQAL